MIRKAAIAPCLLAIALVGCPAPPGPPPEIVLGVIAPFNRSQGTIEGARLAVETINETGGIQVDGGARRLRLVVEDSESSPEVALSKAIKLINTDGVAALIGVPISGNAIPVARLAEERGMPLIATQSSHPEITAGKPHVFRMTLLDSVQGRTMADFAFRRLGARSAMALINAGSAYSTYVGGRFSEVFRRHGGTIVATEAFTEESDIARHLEKIRDARPDVLFLPYYRVFVENHVALAREAGIEATFLGGDTWGDLDPHRHTASWGSYFSDVWAPDSPGETSRDFIRRYRQANGRPPTQAVALTYDAVVILAEAIRSQGSAEPASIRHGLATIDRFEGVSGPIQFDADGNAIRSVYVRYIEEGGEVRLFEVIEP